MDNLEQIFERRKEILLFYSPYSFLRDISPEHIFNKSVKEPLIRKIEDGLLQVKPIIVNNEKFWFLIEYLKWDSEYFDIPTYKLNTVLFESNNHAKLSTAICIFNDQFFADEEKYCFIEIPCEDIRLIQALGSAGYKLIETRMTYYLNLKNFKYQRFEVREATRNDITNLRRIAMEMRNPYDRFHADPVFNQEKADEFLATFIEESIKGFADYIIVPNAQGTPPDAFITAKYLKDEWSLLGVNVAKMVLSAVSSQTCRGWYRKLVSEMAHHLKEIGAEFAFMHPASTNRAVIHTYESLGCELGQVSHIFSKSQTNIKNARL